MGDTTSADDGSARPGRSSKAGASMSSVLTPPVGIPTLATPESGLPLAPPVAPPTAPASIVDPCVCGHARMAHEHYRPGTDCGACGRQDCTAYRPEQSFLRTALRWLRSRS